VDEKSMTLKFRKSDLDGMFSGPCHVKMIPDNFKVTIKFKEYQESSWSTGPKTQPPAPTGGTGFLSLCGVHDK
jgi:hypothetical protein